MALNLDKEYTERPEDQTKCVYCGNELGHNHKHNFGTGQARKHGVEVANGEYILFVDSDDSLKSNACEELYKKIKKEKQLCLCLYL